MRKNVFRLCSLALFCCPQPPPPMAPQPGKKAQISAASLRPYAIAVRSIEPTDEDYSDLMPLIDRIGDSRVVVLGEATHNEGTTSRAKARLVRFLHRKMGFDVLAWESGFVQSYGMNEALRNADVPLDEAKSYLMSGGWAAEEAVHSVFEYARDCWSSCRRPLVMAGFDTGRPHKARQYFLQFLTELVSRAPALSLSQEEWLLIDALVSRGYGFISHEVPDEEQRQRQRDVLDHLLERLRAKRPALLNVLSQRDLLLAERFVQDALTSEHIKALSGALERNYARDRAMAHTLRWLLDVLYPDRKIIVWAATAHFIRNSSLITNSEHDDWYAVDWEAGNHVYPFLQDDLYTIAFTAYAGSYGHIFAQGSRASEVEVMDAAPSGSFEAAAHELGIEYLFVDLRSAPRSHPLKEEFTSVSLGRFINSAPWSQIVDAFFFIDKAEPIRYLP